VYLDYACPHCKGFEDANSEYLNKLLEKEQATIEYKPVAVIGSKLSFTGGNTAACVANYAPEQFLTIHGKLFTLTNSNQNASSSTVRPFIKDLNIPDETKQTIINCINSNVYDSWLNKATDNINLVKDSEGNNLVEGTPTILVDGIKYPFNPESFPQFFEELQTSGKTTQALIDEYSAKLGTSSTSDSQTSKTDIPANNSGE
jgi:protein-disulfide isomerase